MITLRQLEYFVALAEARHFGRAADMVHVTQPALSVQIRALEDHLGTALVERQPRKVILTAAGHELLTRARGILAQVQGLGDVARLAGGLSGPLALGMIPTVAPYLLPAALPLLTRHHPALDLRIRESRTEVLLEALADGHLDAAVVALPSGAPGLHERALFEDRFVLAGSRAAIEPLAGAPEALRPAQLDPDRLLLLEEGHCLADQALEVCALERSQTRVDLSASSLGTLCRLAADGYGLTFVPELALAAEMAALARLTPLRFAPPEPARVVGLVRRGSTPAGAWFDDLATLLERAGRMLTARARVISPEPAPETAR